MTKLSYLQSVSMGVGKKVWASRCGEEGGRGGSKAAEWMIKGEAGVAVFSRAQRGSLHASRTFQCS